MSGPNVFGVARSVWDHPTLQERRAFSRREAWIWLVSEAAWKQRRVRHAGHTFMIERGQIAHSIRFMATAWKWKKTNVERFLRDLKTETMIGTETGAGITITTICNYDKYQVVGLPLWTESGTPSGTEVGQERDSNGTNKKQGNKETIKEDTADAVSTAYFFEAGVIRLTKKDFDKWQDAFPKLSLKAELLSLQEWAGKQQNWFFAVQAALAKRNREVGLVRDKPKVDANVAYWGPDKSRWGII